MDKFVEKAFKDAEDMEMEDEYNAWLKVMKNPEISHLTAAEAVGVERLDKLCRAAALSKTSEALADYAHYLMLTGFHLGYHARMEEERCRDH